MTTPSYSRFRPTYQHRAAAFAISQGLPLTTANHCTHAVIGDLVAGYYLDVDNDDIATLTEDGRALAEEGRIEAARRSRLYRAEQARLDRGAA